MTANARLDDFADVLEQRDANSFFIRCPGVTHHTTPTSLRDTIAYMDGAPTVHCMHHNCADAVGALSLTLRRAFPSQQPFQSYDGGFKTNQRAMRKARAAALETGGRRARERLFATYPWPRCDIWESSPYRLDQEIGEEATRAFLSLAFGPDELLFIGDPKRSDEGAAIRSRKEWLASTDLCARPAICPNPLQRRDGGRRNENIAGIQYVVLEADDLSDDPEINQDRCGALLRWAREVAGLCLFDVVTSGNKSLHGWFAADDRLRASLLSTNIASLLSALGFDTAATRPSQAFRLPGHIRRETGHPQTLLYLDAAASAPSAASQN